LKGCCYLKRNEFQERLVNSSNIVYKFIITIIFLNTHEIVGGS